MGSVGENGTHTTWNVFLGMPMASVGQDDYENNLGDARQIRAALEEHCGWQAFFAGANIPTANDFDTPDLALQINCVALKLSTTFMMVVLQPLTRASSVFVEAGFALALNKPSVYSVRDRRVLPYILREASVHSAAAGIPTVRVCEVNDLAQVIGLIHRHKGDLFKTALTKPRSILDVPSCISGLDANAVIACRPVEARKLSPTCSSLSSAPDKSRLKIITMTKSGLIPKIAVRRL